MQDPEQSEPQQTPSLQKVLAHSVADVHACPAFFRHAPVRLHVCVLVHESGSSADDTTWHVPVPAWQVVHGSAHGPAQQIPPLHRRDSHSPEAPFSLHVLPAAPGVNRSQAVEGSQAVESQPPETSTAPPGKSVPACMR